MGYREWRPYVTVPEKMAKAERAIKKAKKKGQNMSPVMVSSRRTIAITFWGKAWCNNLETYSDYQNRLPRGRSYVRNGSVIDLKIEPGKVVAQVVGSSLYQVEIAIDSLAKMRWESLIKECVGSIASLVELLQGKFSKAVMERLCAPRTGLFPSPGEIRFRCTCPDWASMCKHVAAVLYGVGVRLDEQPELLFTLRQIDAADLVNRATEFPANERNASTKTNLLDVSGLGDLFGIEMTTDAVAIQATQKRKSTTAEVKRQKSSTAKSAARKANNTTKSITAEKTATRKTRVAVSKKTSSRRPNGV